MSAQSHTARFSHTGVSECSQQPIGADEYEQARLLALDMWRDREARFPPRVRRLEPDDMDFKTGSWGLLFAQALDIVRARAVGITVQEVEG